MGDFNYLIFYKEHPSDKRMESRGPSYTSQPSGRHRGVSMSATTTTLPPVMEQHETPDEDLHKKAKRRFSLDFLFSRRKSSSKKGSLDLDNRNKRLSTDSALSEDYTEEEDAQNRERIAEKYRRASANSIRTSKAEVQAWIFS